MSQRARSYGVKAISWPYLGGDGFLAGYPVVALTMALKPRAGQAYTADQIVRMLEAELPGTSRPRWLAILGGDGVADNDLLTCLRSRLQVLVYFETSGLRSMHDSAAAGGRIALYDHVCVRFKVPGPPLIRAQFFHSVVADPGDDEASGLRELSIYLDSLAYNGPRYLSSPGPASQKRIAALQRSTWRLTRPVV